MRRRAKNYLITTERHEVTIMRGGNRSPERGFCLMCADEVDILNFDHAAAVLALGGRELVREIESGMIHPVESDGRFGVCRRSLG